MFLIVTDFKNISLFEIGTTALGFKFLEYVLVITLLTLWLFLYVNGLASKALLIIFSRSSHILTGIINEGYNGRFKQVFYFNSFMLFWILNKFLIISRI